MFDNYVPDPPDNPHDDFYPDPPEDIELPTEPDLDMEPEAWKKCGVCPTLIPVGFEENAPNPRHRWLNGKELCSTCTDEVTDAEQAADEEYRSIAESEAAARADEARGRIVGDL